MPRTHIHCGAVELGKHRLIRGKLISTTWGSRCLTPFVSSFGFRVWVCGVCERGFDGRVRNRAAVLGCGLSSLVCWMWLSSLISKIERVGQLKIRWVLRVHEAFGASGNRHLKNQAAVLGCRGALLMLLVGKCSLIPSQCR